MARVGQPEDRASDGLKFSLTFELSVLGCVSTKERADVHLAHRTAEPIALADGATHRHQRRFLCFRLDPFGHSLKAEIGAHRDQCFGDGGIGLVGDNVPDKAPVNLKLRYRIALQ